MNLEFEPGDRSLTFKEWLQKRYATTPQEIYSMARATGRYGDYDRWMEWCRRRYRLELETMEALISANPFLKQEE